MIARTFPIRTVGLGEVTGSVVSSIPRLRTTLSATTMNPYNALGSVNVYTGLWMKMLYYG